jgi:hypothetical protein
MTSTSPFHLQKLFRCDGVCPIIAQPILSLSPLRCLPMNAEAALAANIQIMQFTTSYWTSRCLHVVAELIADLIGDQPQSRGACESQWHSTECTLPCTAPARLGKSSNGNMKPASYRSVAPPLRPPPMRDYVRNARPASVLNAFGDLTIPGTGTGSQSITRGNLNIWPHSRRATSSTRLWYRNHRDIAAILPAYDFSC